MNNDCRKMQKYYFAVLWEVAIVYDLNKSDIHDMLKVWYKVESTTILSYEELYEYIEKVLYFVMCVFDMYFDSEWYKYEWISWVWMFWSERPDWIKDYKKPDNFNLLF